MILKEILSPLKDVQKLVLACTHYIVLEPSVRSLLPNIEIIDPATEAWKRFRVVLPPKTDQTGKTRFLTTGSATAMRAQSRIAFGVDADVVEISI